MIHARRALVPCLLMTVSLLGGCTGEATPVALEVLVTHQADFDGQRVRTCGILQNHASPRHFWIEDGALHRVGLEPADAVEHYAGQEIEVRGRFTFAAGEGRRIEVAKVTPTAC